MDGRCTASCSCGAVFVVVVVVFGDVTIAPIDGHAVQRRRSAWRRRCSSSPPRRGCATRRSRTCSAALLGFGVGLTIAKALGTALFWADTANTKVRFLHGLIIVVLPYLGLVLGARKGEWLEPAKFVVALQGRAAAEALPDSRHERHHRRPRRRHRRDRVSRRHARRAAVRAEGAAVRRRLVRLAQAQPRPPRTRHPAPHPEDGRRRGHHLRPRLSATSRKST